MSKIEDFRFYRLGNISKPTDLIWSAFSDSGRKDSAGYSPAGLFTMELISDIAQFATSILKNEVLLEKPR
ncbi:hypothetical protein B738_06024 [Photorhabdus temperata subsp. temperata M1021]|nr:hypothetical protein B738_06024 [Photorhabdus temperata subsp. temperata M1021]